LAALPAAAARRAAEGAWLAYGAPAELLRLRDEALRREAGERAALAGKLAAGSAAALSAPHDDASLQAWIEQTHGALRRERPDLFDLKMRKAAADNAAFYRAFPQLFYRLLAESPDALALAATPRLRLAGDLHAENAEVVARQKTRVPQVNDFDDTTVAPAGLEAARAFVGAAFLGRGAAEARGLFQEARAAYRRALKQTFKEWAATVSQEAAVAGAEPKKRHWRRDAGPALSEPEASAARALAGLGPQWEARHREGAGLSSIGVRRSLFVQAEREEAWDLKELREEPAMAAFPGAFEPGEAADRRVALAYQNLRRVPVAMRAVASAGTGWLARERQGKEAALNLRSRASAARALAGLAAQVHRGQGASAQALAESAQSLSPEVAEQIMARLKDLRAALARLLESGNW
ncbi:MAG: DUF2252 family protein, partial [Elusimicrobia bacterium]|nr:DUF2252 family protein [Elusimicrobiota bacterium]